MAAAKKQKDHSTQSIGDAVKILETALLAIKKQQYPKAKDILDKLKEEYPNDLEIRGKILTLIKICEKKMTKDEVAVSASSTDDAAELYNIGVFCHNRREYQEALKCFEKALKKSDSNPDYYYYGMAATKARMENFPGAAEDLKMAVTVSVENFYKAQNDPDFSKFREESELWKTVEDSKKQE